MVMQARDYDAEQRAGALGTVFGVDAEVAQRTCRTISLTASTFVLTIVSSIRFDLPTNLPVLMSIAPRASV